MKFVMSESSIAEAQAAVVAEFAMFEDWQDRYAHLIELGRESPRMNPIYKTEDRKVRGCQSRVWLHSRIENGLLFFEAESDALIVQGLVAILLRVYSGRHPSEIIAAPADFFRQMGLDRHLSQNRTNGLSSMLQEIRQRARISLAN